MSDSDISTAAGRFQRSLALITEAAQFDRPDSWLAERFAELDAERREIESLRAAARQLAIETATGVRAAKTARRPTGSDLERAAARIAGKVWGGRWEAA